jgi:tetratricopeptide (TPR) repeat protein
LGQSQIAIDYYNNAAKYSYKYKSNNKKQYYRISGNLAIQQIYLGEFRKAEMNLRKSSRVQFSHHLALGWLYSYMGQFARASQELGKAINLSKVHNLRNNICVLECYKAWSCLLMGKPSDAYSATIDARELLGSIADTSGNNEILETEIDWLLSESLLRISLEENDNRMLDKMEPQLNSAFTRCRRFSLIFYEPGIMLTMARLYLARGDASQAMERAREALFLADRCQYRLYQAEIHIFLANIDLQENFETAREHAEIAYKKAFCDGLKHCYKSALDEAATLLQTLGVKPPKLK